MKSGTKSGRFGNGFDGRRGRGPKPGAPNAGRPPNVIRQLAAQLVDRHRLLNVLARIAAGDIEETFFDAEGEKHAGETRNADRINATKLLLAYADADINPDASPSDQPQTLTIRVVHQRARS